MILLRQASSFQPRPGAAFALIEATAMLATLVRAARFESRPVQEPIPIWRVVLLPKDGMPLQLTVRRQGF